MSTDRYGYDNSIDALFQALPADSFEELRDNMRKAGFNLTEGGLRSIIKFLRKNANRYGWTIPHVGKHPVYFAVLREKDEIYHSDPLYKSTFMNGSRSMTKRIIAETTNHTLMLRSASQATHLSRSYREQLADLAEDYDYLSRKAKKIFRQIEEDEEGTATATA